MGSPLTGNTVSSTYTALLKTSDTSAVTTTLKTISDGSGNDSALQLSTTAVNTTGNFSVATDKLTVASATGNTAAAGTLACAGNFAVNTNKFSVLAASGNTTVGGTLSVSGAVSLSGGDLTTNNRIVLNGNYGISQNAAAASNLFVAPTTFNGVATFTGGMQFQSAVSMTDDLTVAGVTTLNGNVVLGNAAGDSITVTGTPTFAQTATFNGIANFNGSVALGSDTSDTVTVNAVVGATVKTTPANTDYVYIQDAAASNAFKKTLVSSLLSQVASDKRCTTFSFYADAVGTGIMAFPTDGFTYKAYPWTYITAGQEKYYIIHSIDFVPTKYRLQLTRTSALIGAQSFGLILQYATASPELNESWTDVDSGVDVRGSTGPFSVPGTISIPGNPSVVYFRLKSFNNTGSNISFNHNGLSVYVSQ